MKKIKIILTLLPLTLAFASCSLEDDLDEIFYGKTWYMNGATINGQRLNSDIKNFYTDAGMGAYYITFSSSTFQGQLSAGIAFAGTWKANGKKHQISLNFTNKPDAESTFDKQLYYILSSVKTYESGADILQLKEDSSNKILFGNTR